MPAFLYLTDVFCPWCYGFAPVLEQLVATYPAFPIRVLCGDLVDEPATLETMLLEYPNLEEFLVRLEKTTGQSAQGFIDAIHAKSTMHMDSYAMNIAMAALSKIQPGHELEHVEAFQRAVYRYGKDISRMEIQHAIIAQWNVDARLYDILCEDAACRKQAVQQCTECTDLMGEFRIYPTLFLETDQQRHLLTRGFAPYSIVQGRVQNAIQGTPDPFS